MKAAILLNKANCERYTAPGTVPADLEIIHFGNGNIEENVLIASEADIVLVDPMCPISANVISNMKNLKLVQSQGVGYNMIDLEAADKAGVYVANCAGANATAVAEQAILLMLAILRNVKENDAMVFAAKQIEAKTRCFENGLTDLRDCRVGLVGMGAIGRATTKLLKAFGCEVSYYARRKAENCDLPILSLYELYATCDIISLHVPVTAETTHMIDNDAIIKMKRGTILINTARGEIIDQQAVSQALVDGRLGGFGADTYEPEPVTADNPLLAVPEEYRYKMVLSPHIGGITTGCFYRYFDIAWGNIRRVVNGERPINVVNNLTRQKIVRTAL